MASPHLSPRERAAVLWAEHVTKNTARSRDDVWEEVRRHFTDAEIVEMTLMSGKQGLSNRLMDSLRIPIEPEGEVDRIRTSVQADPEKLRRYLEAVLEHWPKEFPEADGGTAKRDGS